MTFQEYTDKLRELTYDFEHAQGALIDLVTIQQNEEEANCLDVIVTMSD